ncbi:MAG: hypothetical protein A2158_04915 [Chloroflexi bacterium RBG_13_46_14]|nr:MAG: hypothetical protein A2158_04915 [Chloroflexi bacterium RBG_13_46_14]
MIRLLYIICLFSLTLLFSGCSSEPDDPVNMDFKDLKEQLEESGVIITSIDEVAYPLFKIKDEETIFSVRATKIEYKNGGSLLVWEYPDRETAISETKLISRDGYDLSNPEKQLMTHIDWISPPHWFQKGKLIVLYVAPSLPTDDHETLAAVRKILGQQFAGDGPVRDIE